MLLEVGYRISLSELYNAINVFCLLRKCGISVALASTNIMYSYVIVIEGSVSQTITRFSVTRIE